MRIDLDLSKDELTVLRYLTSTAASGRGDPLKDIYEEGDDEPEDPYGSLKSLAAKIDTLKTATDKPLRSMLVIGETIDDARDFIGRDVMGRIDNAAPRKLAIPDEIWPRDEAMTAEFCTPDAIPMRAFDIVVLTASLWGPSSSLYSLARARTKTDGLLWRETPPRIAMPPNGAAGQCIDCGATEGRSFTHDNGKAYHLGCPGAPGGGSLGRIDGAPPC